VFEHKISLKFGNGAGQRNDAWVLCFDAKALIVARRSIGKILLHKAAQGEIDRLLQEQG